MTASCRVNDALAKSYIAINRVPSYFYLSFGKDEFKPCDVMQPWLSLHYYSYFKIKRSTFSLGRCVLVRLWTMLQCLLVPVCLCCSTSCRACCVFNAYNHKSPLCVCAESFTWFSSTLWGVSDIYFSAERGPDRGLNEEWPAEKTWTDSTHFSCKSGEKCDVEYSG